VQRERERTSERIQEDKKQQRFERALYIRQRKVRYDTAEERECMHPHFLHVSTAHFPIFPMRACSHLSHLVQVELEELQRSLECAPKSERDVVRQEQGLEMCRKLQHSLEELEIEDKRARVRDNVERAAEQERERDKRLQIQQARVRCGELEELLRDWEQRANNRAKSRAQNKTTAEAQRSEMTQSLQRQSLHAQEQSQRAQQQSQHAGMAPWYVEYLKHQEAAQASARVNATPSLSTASASAGSKEMDAIGTRSSSLTSKASKESENQTPHEKANTAEAPATQSSSRTQSHAIPPHYQVRLSKTRGKPYYLNTLTGACTWEIPTDDSEAAAHGNSSDADVIWHPEPAHVPVVSRGVTAANSRGGSASGQATLSRKN
jgi:hypothetical protein